MSGLYLDAAQQRAVDQGDVAKLAREIGDMNRALDRWCDWQDDMSRVLKSLGVHDRVTARLMDVHQMPTDGCRHAAEVERLKGEIAERDRYIAEESRRDEGLKAAVAYDQWTADHAGWQQ
jgi:hypothetical protein